MKRERATHREFRNLRPVATVAQGPHNVGETVAKCCHSIFAGAKCKAIVLVTPLGDVCVLREDALTAVNLMRYHPDLIAGVYSRIDADQAWEDVAERWKETHQGTAPKERRRTVVPITASAAGANPAGISGRVPGSLMAETPAAAAACPGVAGEDKA